MKKTEPSALFQDISSKKLCGDHSEEVDHGKSRTRSQSRGL
ncbi:hypothetical protein [Paenibacillus roseipurpureus]|uniref:Uncharacterized protein n=1 Tax=Paenibacillus roseopurpureus TaxID=2918901 RepID=A0AA96RL75_9BACL|nr:hypothetical protein [Paenibacillus sp. MBLB1832]WNR47163.1 hypothetical protein MJB10_15955 [Paenibacillus sp. MBLB1832]